MHLQIPTILALALDLTATTHAFPPTYPSHPPHNDHQPAYSLYMAHSIISRHQAIFTSTSDRSALLQAGFTQNTFRHLLVQYPSNPDISAYSTLITTSVLPTLLNTSTPLTTYPLDRLSTATGLLDAYASTSNSTFKAGFDALASSVDSQPRNADESLWYYVYPNYTYLDGMYSLAPFLTLFHDDGAEEAVRQLELVWNHTYQPSSGLLVHGYDASRLASWTANSSRGASEWVWGRSLGWYCMALVDVLEVLPAHTHTREWEWLVIHFQALMYSVVGVVDERTGAWWQVMDQPGKKGNYIESSASAMFVYALLKGVREGYLDEEVVGIATRAYKYLVDAFVVENKNGTLGWNGTVSVCSLNSSATYEYYVGQPILYNSVLGSAAFVLASLEYEKLDATTA